MAVKKITLSIEKTILQEARKNPYLGVRLLADLLLKEHKIKISKSTVNKILISAGVKEKKGRRRAILLYKSKGIKNCGLILLKCLDYHIGMFDYVSKELKRYFPEIEKDLLEKLIVFNAFSAFIGKQPRESAKEQGFLRLANIGHLPLSKLDYFNEKLTQLKPVVNLAPIKENVKFVSTIKFYFNNGCCAYVDAKMSTLWDGPCNIEHFFLTQIAATRLIEAMLKDKTLFIGYTKSFDYISALVFDFIKGINSGINTIELLDKDGRLLKEIKIASKGFSFFIGYCPKRVAKSMFFVTKLKRPKMFSWEELGDLFCTYSLTRFTQHKEKKGVILNNVLIKNDPSSASIWGLIASGNVSIKKAKLAAILKRYLYLWPYLDKTFLEDLAVIEKALAFPVKNKDYLTKMLPASLSFKNIYDFAKLTQILSIFFKERVWGWEPKIKTGDFSIGKDFIKISLKKAPREVRKAFNKSCFYLNKKRAFLV